MASDGNKNQRRRPFRDCAVHVADVFAGAGGLSLGFYLAGCELALAVDVNPYRRETYETNMRVGKFVVADVRALDFSAFKDVDILLAGPPCRPYSCANRLRPGPLHPEYGVESALAELIEAAKPKVVVVEEVLSAKERLLRLVERLSALGYDHALRKVDFYEYGVPQRRRRAFLIGARAGRAARIFALLRKMKTPGPTVGEAIGDLPLSPAYAEEKWVDEPGWLYGRYTGLLLNHETPRHRETTLRVIRAVPPGYSLRRAAREGRLPPDLAKKASERHSYKYLRLDPTKPAPTLPNVRASMVLHPRADRVLTVRETARLQAFPDWFRFKGPLDEKYRQVADAVPPLFSHFLALAILKFLGAARSCNHLGRDIYRSWVIWPCR
ncbi:MAG: DNA cytosine methyltransferase [Thermofilum sp.]|jgi:DNA (cytosine-5)-methyltransferase 1|nr:DNA cytosine methyltransferase [Thermofilum sp.]MCC6064558.1 DNA cytosine methyltransferase [Thermofilum sp.]